MEGESRMKEKGILIRADYGHIALHLREIMEERDITRNQLAKRIDARFEVVNKWYQGSWKNGSGYPRAYLLCTGLYNRGFTGICAG